MELEDCLRQNNIRIDGVKEDSEESWEECEKRAHSIFKERLDIQKVEMERVQKVVRKTRSKPRTIVC